MRQTQRTLHIATRGREFTNITAVVQKVLTESGLKSGLCTLFLRHTSAGLVVQENADPDVRSDLNAFLDRLVPEDGGYRHEEEGADDMPAHIRSVLTRTSEVIPFDDARLCLGIWQALYLWEHRRSGHERELVVHLLGQ